MTLTHRTAALLAGLSLLALPACSSHHPGAVHRGSGYWEHARGHDVAYDRGYRDGLKAGLKDWKRGRRFDVWRHGRYRSGHSGYRSRYGARSHYQRAYRAGFRTGYHAGYGSYRGRSPRRY
jgi:hypothetical protein